MLSRFYGRNLEQKGEDFDALRALAASEVSLNEHLERVFEPTLKSLAKLGYPGLSNPRMMIRSALDPAQIMSSRDGALVHYALGPDDGAPDPPTLPDWYNGLGFKNLIFMVLELLDLHAQWLAIEDNRPPVHLIFIEEPGVRLNKRHESPIGFPANPWRTTGYENSDFPNLMPFSGRIFGRPHADRIDHPFRGRNGTPRCRLECPYAPPEPAAHGVEQRCHGGLSGTGATSPQRRRDPRFCGT